MPDIDPGFMCHCLSVIQGAKLVIQKQRKQGEERRKAEREETNRLLTVGFIREVQYPTWLANVVMVKKSNGRWRMCMDYTDLNKACPKDPYPLPSIDKLVDGVSGYALLNFMDAYSGYNQIRMHPQDEEKTTFITEARAFCYKVMPFGLKNVGATYQRLMDKIFREIIGINIEVYVDDMVVKSTEAAGHCEALERVFSILRKHQLRLNPEKYSIGVHTGKFLGFMLTKRGIEANLDKCQAVINMRSPQNVRKVQQLMGRIMALSRFISRSAETARPIFGALKKAGSFTWTPECEEAFLKFKAMLATPPVLTRSTEGIPLYLYISVSNVAISAECKGNQRLVYFISKLFEFDISFERRGHVKAQALAEFLTELTLGELNSPVEETVKGEWYLSVDGSSNHFGSRVGVILEGPAGIIIEKSLHFKFKARNNQAEYEALLTGMRLA
ncbi:hypothetical protein CR513_48397, partial [Mucuna pruriens]